MLVRLRGQLERLGEQVDQGPPKATQRHKVLADAFKLTWIATTIYPRPKLILCLSDPQAAAPVLPTSRSWAAQALQDLSIVVTVVHIPDEVRLRIQDLAAVVAEAGGTASVYGHSSGAALVLQAAASGLPVDRIVLHDPPFGSGSEEERRAEQEELQRFEALVAEDRREDVVRLFATSTGMPAEMADALTEDPMMVANAPTILYEYELLSEKGRAGRGRAR